MKICITTQPFGELPLKQLEDYDVIRNISGAKLSANEVEWWIDEHDPEIIVAGTEKYDRVLLTKAKSLKLISRVGIGVDSVDLEAAAELEIFVTNTPDAPSNAVAELTIAQMLNMLRRIPLVRPAVNKWTRYIGRDLRDCTVGVIGCGRIGRLVIEKLQGLKPRRIYANDIIPNRCHGLPRTEPKTKMQIFSECNIVTLHIPYNKKNHHYVDIAELALMKPQSMLINTSRGSLINETKLCNWLIDSKRRSAAIDVYEDEPYTGPLIDLSNAYLTPHLGSCTERSRFDMEMGAVEEALNFINGKPFNNRVV